MFCGSLNSSDLLISQSLMSPSTKGPRLYDTHSLCWKHLSWQSSSFSTGYDVSTCPSNDLLYFTARTLTNEHLPSLSFHEMVSKYLCIQMMCGKQANRQISMRQSYFCQSISKVITVFRRILTAKTQQKAIKVTIWIYDKPANRLSSGAGQKRNSASKRVERGLGRKINVSFLPRPRTAHFARRFSFSPCSTWELVRRIRLVNVKRAPWSVMATLQALLVLVGLNR